MRVMATVRPPGSVVTVGLTTCLIQGATATITFDTGAQITIPRRFSDPPEKTANSVAKVLRVDRFEYSRTALPVGREIPRLPGNPR
jgi:hypothetical protein